MLKTVKIGVGRRYVTGLQMRLGQRNLVVIKGRRGWVGCGYFDLSCARKFKDAAVKITGVSTVSDALKAKVSALTPAAAKLGIRKGQLIKDAIKSIC